MRKRDISAYPGSKNVPPFKPLLFNVLPAVHTFVDCFTGSGFVSSTVEKYVYAISCYESYKPTRDQLIDKFSGSVDKIVFTADKFELSMLDPDHHSLKNLPGTVAFFMDPPYMFSTR